MPFKAALQEISNSVQAEGESEKWNCLERYQQTIL